MEQILRGVLTEAWTGSERRADGHPLDRPGRRRRRRPDAAPAARRRHRGRRRHRRRGLHRPLDRLPPAARRPGPARRRRRAARSPGSARAGATAAGARRCSRRARPRWPAGTAAAAALAMGAAMRDTVDEVGKAVAEEGIACDWVKGGTVALARTPAQLRRARAEAGFLVAGAQASALRRRHPACSAASYTPDCARDPARAARARASRGPSSAAAGDRRGARPRPRSGRAGS